MVTASIMGSCFGVAALLFSYSYSCNGKGPQYAIPGIVAFAVGCTLTLVGLLTLSYWLGTLNR